MSQILASRVSDAPPEPNGVLRDLVTGALSVMAATFLGVSHFRQGGRLHDDFGAEPGPAFLPELLLTVLGAAGIVLIIRGVLSYRTRRSKVGRPAPAYGADPSEAVPQSEPVWAFLVLSSMIAFGVFQAIFGFGIAAAALGATICAMLAYREGRPIPRSLAEGIAVAVVLYGVFRILLSVPLT